MQYDKTVGNVNIKVNTTWLDRNTMEAQKLLNMSVMNAEYQKCQGELNNLTRTTMNQAQVDLTRMLDEAEMRVASGVQSYSSAVCEILDNYAKRAWL